MDGIILIDKPKGITSFDVCHKIKKICKTNKVGHSGTLDPNATGLLLVAINRATKTLNFLPHVKTYLAKVEFGYETDTLDPEGKVIKNAEINPCTKEELQAVANEFLGDQLQVPPMYSAKKINGKKLYEYARENIDIDIKASPIHIFSIKIVDVFDNGFTYEATVSRGTFIRVLSLDIARKSNNIATTTEIRRTRIGNIDVSKACNFDNIKLIDPNDLIEFEAHVVEDEADIRNGKKISINSNEQLIKIVSKENKLLAVYEKDGEIYRSKRGLF